MSKAIRARVRVRPHFVPWRSGWVLFGINALGLVLVLAMLFGVQTSPVAMKIGDVAGTTVVAPRQVVYVDNAATAAKRRQAADLVATAYRYDTQLALKRRQQAAKFLTQVGPVIASRMPGDPRRRQREVMDLLARFQVQVARLLSALPGGAQGLL